jgi:hypothetical protein
MKDTKILEIINEHLSCAYTQTEQCAGVDLKYYQGVVDGLLALRNDINELMKLEKSLMKYRATRNKS